MATPQSQPIGWLGFWSYRRPRSSPTHLVSLTYTPARPPNAVIRSLHTAIPARARDHLQRTRSPHELYSPTRSQGPTGGKLRLPGGAAKHHCAQEPTLGPKRRCADMAANPALRDAHVRAHALGYSGLNHAPNAPTGPAGRLRRPRACCEASRPASTTHLRCVWQAPDIGLEAKDRLTAPTCRPIQTPPPAS